jgi:hypothetical protein
VTSDQFPARVSGRQFSISVRDPTDSVRSRQAVVGRARHAVTMVQGVGAKESEHRDAELPQPTQSSNTVIADSACASILKNLASPSAAAGSAGEQVSRRLSGGTRLSTLAPHPTIDASTRGRGRIAHRSAELGYGRTAVDVVWIRDEKCPFMPAKASPNHKLDALVDHEVRSGCCGTDVAAGSTQTRRQRYRRTG